MKLLIFILFALFSLEYVGTGYIVSVRTGGKPDVTKTMSIDTVKVLIKDYTTLDAEKELEMNKGFEIWNDKGEVYVYEMDVYRKGDKLIYRNKK